MTFIIFLMQTAMSPGQNLGEHLKTNLQASGVLEQKRVQIGLFKIRWDMTRTHMGEKSIIFFNKELGTTSRGLEEVFIVLT